MRWNKYFQENKVGEESQQGMKSDSNELLKEKIKEEIKKDELIRGLVVKVKQLERKLDNVCKSINESFTTIGNEFDKLEKDIDKMKNEVPYTTSKSMTSYNTVTSSITHCTTLPRNTVSSAKNKKSDCELFNEQINSGILSPQFKSIKLTCEGTNKMIENPEGINLFYIVEKENDNFELYPNHKVKELRVINAVKDVYEIERKGSTKIVVDRPCILRKLMYGYGIESKGKVRIL